MRAAVYGLEAVITTKVIQSGGNVAGFDERKEAQEELKSGREGFSALNNLRNALAHGVRSPDPRVERALKNEANLRNTSKSLLTQLLDLQPKEGA